MSHVLTQILILAFLTVAISGLGVGVGLMLSKQTTSRFFRGLNLWLSTHHVLGAVETPDETVTHPYQRWLAGAFALGGLIAAFGLVAAVDVVALSQVLVDGSAAPFVAVALDWARWLLVVGSVAGVVVGATLLFAPNAEGRLETFTDRWVSRRVVRGWDDMHASLDRLVEAHPVPAAWLLVCTSAAAALCAVLMLVRTS
jgi:hypothetical protein